MAIAPPSDIVLDVAKAVDPLQYQEATAKLARLSDTAIDAADSFQDLLGGYEADPVPPAESAAPIGAPDPARADLRARLASASAEGAVTEPARPYQQLEAFVLQSFIQQMLPKDSESVYGQGLAGNYWSSMLAEQIATTLAESGGIGLANVLAEAGGGAGAPSLRGTLAVMQLGAADPSALISPEG